MATRAASGPPVLRDLRSSHIRLLSLTPPDGMRVSDLAERVGLTKQALGEFATALEGLGLTVVEASAALIADVEPPGAAASARRNGTGSARS